jgi:hypothetical protein
MPGSTISAFGEPDDYQAELRRDGGFDLLVTGRGEFWAQLSRVELSRIKLVAGEESLSRISFISLPQQMVRVSLPARAGTLLFWDGIPSHAGGIVTHSGGLRLHERTEGPSLWGVLWVSMTNLRKYGQALIGPTFDIPPGACWWRPAPKALSCLVDLHDSAIRISKAHPRMAAGAEAARGLELQLFDALVGCMLVAKAETSVDAARRQVDITSQLEDFIQANSQQNHSESEICAALGVSARALRTSCKTLLGMGPMRYLHLRRTQPRQAQRNSDPVGTSASQSARRESED